MTIQSAPLGSLANYRSLLERLHQRAEAVPPAPVPSPGMTPDRLIRTTEKTYAVRGGDTLSAIARHMLGSGDRWPEIYALNRDLLKDPNHIYPGQVLRLPGPTSRPLPAPSVQPPSMPVPAAIPVPSVQPPAMPVPAAVPAPPVQPPAPSPTLAAFSAVVAQYRAAKLGSLTPDQLKALGQHDKQAFFDALRPAAEQAEQQYGVPAAVTLAQAALESGWGEHAIGGYNIFGIKGRGPSGSVQERTQEYENGRNVSVDASFARYDSFDQAILAHGELFHNGYYDRAVAGYQRDRDPREFAKNLDRVYATDPHYTEKILDLMDTYHLA